MTKKLSYLTRLALLFAIIVVLTVLNIGNIPIGPIVATIYQVPVIIGACMLGVGAGAFLGGAWGVLCFVLALTGQTTDVVALTVVGQSPLLYFVIAFVPRLLMGTLAGVLFCGLNRVLREKVKPVSYAVCGFVGSALNTAFYLSSLYLLIRETLATLYSIDVSAVGAMVWGVAVANGLPEAVVSCVLCTAICSALSVVFKKK